MTIEWTTQCLRCHRERVGKITIILSEGYHKVIKSKNRYLYYGSKCLLIRIFINECHVRYIQKSNYPLCRITK